jgi:LytR cell envelope-related transcriptional attenuator
VIVGVVVIVLAVSSLGGGSSKNATGTSAASTTPAHSHRTHTGASTSSHPSESSALAVSPAETQVAVLNGTSTEGLAHRLSATLQQSGYSQAIPLNGTPPGAHQTTVVQYASGHRAEAAQVARALGVGEVQPMEATVSPLVGNSTVVVIAGLDKAGAPSESSSSSSSSSESSSESSPSP